MPGRKKQQAQHRPVEDYPDPHENDHLSGAGNYVEAPFEDTPAIGRVKKSKSKNAHVGSTAEHDSSSEALPLETTESLPRIPHLTSRLGQLNFSAQHTRPLDIKNVSEKVTDQASEYTPPSDGGLDELFNAKSPRSVAISSPLNTPPAEPGFSRRSAHPQSPQPSPASRYTRPVSISNTCGAVGLTTDHASRYGSPPAPHLPQPHFYGVPDMDLGLPHDSRVNETFSKFVHLPSSTLCNPGIAIAYGNKLVFSNYAGTSVEVAGSLNDLPGVVLDAEPLHWTTGQAPFAELRPLVALTLLCTDTSEPHNAQRHLRVCIYSLFKQCHILDLLYLPCRPSRHYAHLVPRLEPTDNHLTLVASGNYLSVVSQRSGEIFIFCPGFNDENVASFNFVAKLWTTVQISAPRKRQSSQSREHDTTNICHQPTHITTGHTVALFTMSGRWLAVCPPISSPASIMARLGQHVNILDHTSLEAQSGSRPTTNCEVDSPDADTILAKVARNVAQEVVKAGRWMSERGSQLWSSYWDKSTQGTPNNIQHQPPMYGAQPEHFPPTHAEEQQASKNLEIVSIFDLKALTLPNKERNSPNNAFATFKPPNGCSYLTMSPDGLMLLTASRTGEYQYVWNLMEANHAATTMDSPTASKAEIPTTKVHQIARFDRLSTSTVVDVAWSKGNLAILTQNKTVHLFEIPALSMIWPLVRTQKRPRPLSAPPSEIHDLDPDAAPAGGFLASAMSFASKNQPTLTTMRGRTPSTSTGLAGLGHVGIGIASATGVKGTRAVAAGLSKSLGAATETMTRIQHAGDNKLHIKGEQELPAGHLSWFRRNSSFGLCIIDGSTLRYWQVKSVSGRDARIKGSLVFDSRKPSIIRFPALPEHQTQWRTTGMAPPASATHPLTHAEIETTAPFRPFIDSRVSMLWYDKEGSEDTTRAKGGHTAGTSHRWVFGDDIPARKMQINISQSIETGSSTMIRQSVIRHSNG